MKKHRLFSVLCVIPLLAFLSCSDDSDSSSEGGGANLFASPKTVIYYMDTGNSVSVSSTSRSARAVSVDTGELSANGDSLTIAQLQGLVLKDSDCSKSVLSGEETPVYAILDIVKNEIYEAVGELVFNRKYDFESPVTAARSVHGIDCDFKVNSFEARYTNGSETAYLYLTMGVEKFFEAVCVIKCTPNEVGTLDVSFYYEYANNADVYSFVEFKVVSGKKTKIEYGIDNDEGDPYWEKFEITASKISGYHYKTESGNSRKKAFVVNSADYCAVYSEKTDNGSTSRAVHTTTKDGSRIRTKGLSSDASADSTAQWMYYLPYLEIPSGFSVKRIDNNNVDEYYLYKDDNTKYRLEQSEKYKKHWYRLYENGYPGTESTNLVPDVFNTKISLENLSDLDVPTDSSAFPDEEKPDTAELKTLLAAWRSSAE